jgi:transcriptional regulator with XRE-family HTH domain
MIGKEDGAMSDDGKKRLGARIRQARLDAGISQKELAHRVGLTQGVISTVEHGVSTIDAPKLPMWATALGKPVMYFYLGEGLETVEQRAMAVLGMFPPDRFEFVLQMLENMALTMKQENEIGY